MCDRLGGVIVTSGKAELACDTAGHGEPVLLLHADVADSRSWAKVVDVLAPTRQSRDEYDDPSDAAVAWPACLPVRPSAAGS
jgi:hypothetical protein